jgi:glyoxylase-like metal-dependent hydrolase (beta-lactamase superfamily II)
VDLEGGLNGMVAQSRGFASGARTVSGIGRLAFATPGHTPRHSSVMISSGSRALVVQGDVTNPPTVFARNPGCTPASIWTQRKPKRRDARLYNRAASEGFLISGYHYPFPAVGRISREGEGYRVDLV